MLDAAWGVEDASLSFAGVDASGGELAVVSSTAAGMLSFAEAGGSSGGGGGASGVPVSGCPISVRSGGVEVAGELTDSGGSGSRISDGEEGTDIGVAAGKERAAISRLVVRPLRWLRPKVEERCHSPESR